jgi:hypothetical protein
MRKTTSERLKLLIESRQIRQVDILNAAKPFCEKYGVKLERNDLSQYVSGKVLPGQDKLTVLGLALNVSEAWLMGFDVPMEREIAPAAQEEGNERLTQVVELFKLLSKTEQEIIIRQIKGLLSSR